MSSVEVFVLGLWVTALYGQTGLSSFFYGLFFGLNKKKRLKMHNKLTKYHKINNEHTSTPPQVIYTSLKT